MNHDPMGDASNAPQSGVTGEPAPNDSWTTVPPTDTAGRVGFCQDCGKPLTAETVRAVGTGVFCEPCLTARVGVPPVGTVPLAGVPVPAFGEANPVLAGFLGLIPGVGAMYNGQYSKGFAHLIIFVLLDSIEKNVNSVFGIFVLAWVFYQVFDAYHTAKARNAGLPLPNVFGLNDIGERMGFGKSATGSASWSSATRPPVSGWQAPPTYPAGGPVPSGPDWVGYVPPTNFGGASVPPPVPPSYPTAAYGETFSAAAAPNPYAAVPPIPPVVPMTPVVPPSMPERRFPTGAIWLIGLGLLILLANWLPDWKLTERWWPPVLFAGLAVWIFLKRLRRGTRLICILRAPVVLMALAIMFTLHAADIYINFGMVCAVVFIVLGALLMLERTLGSSPVQVASPAYVPTEPTRVSFVPATDHVVPPAATVEHDPADDTTKGGLSR